MNIIANKESFKMKSTNTEEPKIETHVLIPSEFVLSVMPKPLPPLDRLISPEDSIKVCATRKIRANEKFSPMNGTLRMDKLPSIPILSPVDVSINIFLYSKYQGTKNFHK